MSSDPDPTATQEWLDALDSVLEFEGTERATFLLDERVSLAGSLVLCPFNFMMNDDVESPSTCSLNVSE